MKIQATKLGTACAVTGVLFYLGCAGLMAIFGQEGTIWFFNSILHGFDITPIIRMEVPIFDASMGMLITAILSGFSGWLVATIYNKLA